VFLALTGEALQQEPAGDKVAPAQDSSLEVGHEREEIRHG